MVRVSTNSVLSSIVAVGIFGLASLYSGNAFAEKITFTFEGSVQRIERGDPSLLGVPDLLIGTVVTGRYTFDPTVPDSNPHPNAGAYDFAVTEFEVSFSDISSFELDTSNFTRILTTNDAAFNSFVDGYGVEVFNDSDVSAAFGLSSESQCIPNCPISDLLISDAMPLTPPDLLLTEQESTVFPGFQGRRLTIFIDEDVIVDAVISKLEAVPSFKIENELSSSRQDGFSSDMIFTNSERPQFKAFRVSITNQTGQDGGLSNYVFLDMVPEIFDVRRVINLSDSPGDCSADVSRIMSAGGAGLAARRQSVAFSGSGLNDEESCLFQVEVATKKSSSEPQVFEPTDCPTGDIDLNKGIFVFDSVGDLIREESGSLELECW